MTHNWEDIGWNVWSWGDILVVEKSESFGTGFGTSSNRIDFRTEPVFIDDDFQPRWILKKSNRLLPRYFSIWVLDLKWPLEWPCKINNSPQHLVYKLGHGIHWTVPNEDCLHDSLLDTCTRSGNIFKNRKWDRKYLFIVQLTISLINVILFLCCRLCCFDLTWRNGPAKNLRTVRKEIASTERIVPVLLLDG